MARKIKLFLAFSALLFTTMCKMYDDGGLVTSTNGLSCQNYTSYGYGSFEEGADCSYICPDRTVKQIAMPDKLSASSALYSASKEDLDAQFCAGILQPTPIEPPASTTATLPASPTAQASPVASSSPTPPLPLLTGEVTSCDRSVNLINFRMVEVAPDLNGKELAVRISDLASTCAVNTLNPSLLTCTTQAQLNFPMRVVVRVDGAVVNDFTSDGFGCLRND
jgi:hypothetical protein